MAHPLILKYMNVVYLLLCLFIYIVCGKVVVCFGTQVYDNVNAQRKAQKRNEEKRKQE